MTDSQPRPKRILVVDDELVNRKVIEGFLKAFGHDCVLAESGVQALDLLDPSFDLVLLDIMMPDMDGFSVLRELRQRTEVRDLPVIMVTALNSKEDRLKAVEAGANDFVAKPIDKTELKVRMTSLLRMKAAQDEVKNYQIALEDMVRVRTEALALTVENLLGLQKGTEAAHLETIYCLSSAAEYKDEETAQHIKRMSLCSALLARKIGLPDHECNVIQHSSPMHDIGKIGIPDAILLKPGKLTEEEWVVMKKHAQIGAQILSTASSEYLETGRLIALTHHERWDGSGYPAGLAGENIPLHGRISAVADVFDALLSKRPYKQPFTVAQSLQIMTAGRGTHFDPRILDLFLENLDEVLSIQSEFKD